MSRRGGNSTTVLLIEPDPAEADGIASGLETSDMDFRVITTSRTEEAIQRVRSDDVDCVLDNRTDAADDSLAVVERVREHHPHIPFLLAVDSTERRAEAAIAMGVDDVVCRETVTNSPPVLANRIENTVTAQLSGRTELTVERRNPLVELPTDFLVTTDRQGTIQYATPSIEHVLGYAPTTVIGTTLDDLVVHRDQNDDLVGHICSLGDNDHHVDGKLAGVQDPLEVRATHSDGSTRWLELRARDHRADPTDGAVVVALRDVTERKTLTDTLTTLQEASRELVTVPTKTAVCEEVLAIARDVLGLPHAAVFLWDKSSGVLRPEAVDQEVRDIFDEPPKFGRGEGITGHVFETGDAVILDEAQSDPRALDLDDASDWINAFIAVPLGSHGVMTAASPSVGAFDGTDLEIAKILGANAMIAFDQLDSQAELARQRDLFARAQTIASVGAWEYDASTGQLWWSDEVAGIFDLPSGLQVTPTPEGVVDAFHPEDRPLVRETIQRAIRDHEQFDLEVRLQSGDRPERWVRVRGDPQVEQGTLVCIRGTINDISARKENQRHLGVLDRLLRHNLRNEMTAIRGFAEMIQRDTDGHVRDWATDIIDHSDRLIESVEKEREIVTLLTEASNRRRIDVVSGIREIVDNVDAAEPEATITLECPETAIATATENFTVAVRELLDNAIQHNDRVRPSVTVTVEKTMGSIVIHVTDNGPGIPEDDRRAVIGELETHDLSHGSGVGLWLVDWIVRRSEGTLAFDRAHPRGTTVTIALPRERSESESTEPAPREMQSR